MLKQPQPGSTRRRSGALVLGLVLASCSYAAWAVRPVAAPLPPPAPAHAADVSKAPPAPPAPPAAVAAPAPPAAPPAVAPPAPPAAPVMPAPRYPAEAIAARQSGRVVLKVLVASDGSVADVVVEQSTPEGVFDAATLEAARNWRFNPAQADGKPVGGWIRVPVDFALD